MGEATSIVSPATALNDAIAVDAPTSDASRTTVPQPATVTEARPATVTDQPTVIDDDGREIRPEVGARAPVIRRPATSTTGTRPMRPRPSRMLPLLRRQTGNPEEFYRYLAQDTVRLLRQYLSVKGALAVDIGGGPGYVAEELHAAGATSCVIAESPAALLGRDEVDAEALGDSQVLPVASDSMQIVHSANVLEHVSLPYSMLAEMVRVLKPHDGIGYLTFTNWYSPRGHEPAPWPTLGGNRAARRVDPRTGAPLQSDYPLHVSDVLRWFECRRDVEVLWSGPRYLPPWLRWVVAVPGMREAFSWNLVVVFRKRRRP